MLLVLLIGAAAAGCDNSCVTFVWNSGGTTPVAPPSCSLTKANASVDLRVTSIAAPGTGTGAMPLRHIFITLRGVQARPSETAGNHPSDWADLAPRLASSPVQVDLMAPAADSCASSSLAENNVVAGVYGAIRLLLLSNQEAASGPAPQENFCGSVGFNCIVTADGAARPLAFDGEKPELFIWSDRIPSGSFRILPDTHTNLALEFNPYASTVSPAAEAVRLSPVFTLDVRGPCDPAAP